MTTENNQKTNRLGTNKKLRDFLKAKSIDAQAASIAILSYMQRNKISQLDISEIISQSNELSGEISKIPKKLPKKYNLEEMDLSYGSADLHHAKMNIRRQIAPSLKMTPLGADACLNELQINAVKNIAVVSDDIVYSEELAKYAENLTHYFKNKDDAYYSARRIMFLNSIEENACRQKNYIGKLKLGNEFLQEKRKKFDVIVICQNEEDDSAFLEKAKALVASDGAIIYCVSPKLLKSDEEIEVRKNFIKSGILKAVFELKNSYGNSIFAAIVLTAKKNEAIQFISVENIVPSLIKPKNGKSRIAEIECSKILEKETCSLSPDFYINNISNREDYKVHSKPLGEIVEISRGCYTSISKIEERFTGDPTEIKYLNVSGIEGGRIKEDIPNLTELEKLEEKYCASKGDFVISKIANPPRFAEVTSDEKILVSVNLYILRVKPEFILPKYFKAFMTSETGQMLLRSIARGSGNLSVMEIKDLKNLMIPCPEVDDQKEFIKKLRKKEEEEKLLEKKLNELRKSKQTLLEDLIK